MSATLDLLDDALSSLNEGIDASHKRIKELENDLKEAKDVLNKRLIRKSEFESAIEKLK